MPQIVAVPYQQLIKVFEKDGFRFARQTGDHLIYTKPGLRPSPPGRRKGFRTRLTCHALNVR